MGFVLKVEIQNNTAIIEKVFLSFVRFAKYEITHLLQS